MIDSCAKRPETLRSARWFAPDDLRSSGHRSRRALNEAGCIRSTSSRPIKADQGRDFDFLQSDFGHPVAEFDLF